MLSSALQIYAAKRELVWGGMHLVTEVNMAGERFTKAMGASPEGQYMLAFWQKRPT